MRRAFADVLPEDARNRRKSAYPASNHPDYLKGVRNWVLKIINEPASAVKPFINVPLLINIAEGRTPMADNIITMLFERIIQINHWLEEYPYTIFLMIIPQKCCC